MTTKRKRKTAKVDVTSLSSMFVKTKKPTKAEIAKQHRAAVARQILNRIADVTVRSENPVSFNQVAANMGIDLSKIVADL
jgi:hypothetical protein